MSSIIDYTEFPGLEELYLEEDSYILGIKEVATAVIFTVDAVLTPEHPQYHPPGPDEQNCYKRITITFSDISKVNWVVRDMQVHRDASGEPDLGIFYRIVRIEGYFELSGEFGEIHIYGDSFPRVEYE